jgi:hypothetical protein
MYTLHAASLPPYEAELSRQAAERYALLTAAKEQRRSTRPAPRRPRAAAKVRIRAARRALV